MTHEFVRRPDRNAGDRDDLSSPQKKSKSNKNFHARPSSDRNGKSAVPDRTQEDDSDGKLDGDAWVRSLEGPSAPSEESKPAVAPAPEQDADLLATEAKAVPESLAKTSDKEGAESAVAPTVEEVLPASDRQATRGSASKAESELEDGSASPAPDVAEGMGEARSEFEVLKQEALLAELKSQQEDCNVDADAQQDILEIEQAIADPTLLERMQATLQQANEHGPKAAFVYIHLLPEGVETILLPPSGSPILEFVKVDEMVGKERRLGAEGILREARSMMFDMEFAQIYPEYILNHPQFLYRQTIKPLEEHLKQLGIEHIQLVLDGRLQHVSMAALHDGEGYLIERFSIAYSHSFQQTEIETDERDYGNAEIVALGQSEFTNQSDLDHARTEIDSINALDGNPPADTTLTKESIQSAIDAFERGREILGEEQLERLLADNGIAEDERELILHFATHGEGTFLYAAGGEELGIDELRNIDFESVELIVMGACDTAIGGPHHPQYGSNQYVSDRAYGLSGEAVKAGADTAVGSKYPVPDEQTKQLMILFHYQLRERGLGAAEAMQHAQVAMLKGEVKEDDNLHYTLRDREFIIPIQELQGIDPSLFGSIGDSIHQGLWGGFQIIGDWE